MPSSLVGGILAMVLGSPVAGLPSLPGPPLAQEEALPSSSSAVIAGLLAWAQQEQLNRLPPGPRMAALGRQLLGTPYAAHSLEAPDQVERLILEAQRFDCMSFLETVQALSIVVGGPTPLSLEACREALRQVRYRNGRLRGYASRLHYLTDHFRNNERMGLLRIITRDVGGRAVRRDLRPLRFMSQHAAAYAALRSRGPALREIRAMERRLRREGGYDYIPTAAVEGVEARLASGDLLGLTTAIPGLDTAHAGIAVREVDGRIHLLHASLLEGKVVVSRRPLAEFLAADSRFTGLIVARVERSR